MRSVTEIRFTTLRVRVRSVTETRFTTLRVRVQSVTETRFTALRVRVQSVTGTLLQTSCGARTRAQGYRAPGAHHVLRVCARAVLQGTRFTALRVRMRSAARETCLRPRRFARKFQVTC